MNEVDAGVAKRIDSYLSRVRRIAYLRALSATLNNQLAQASSLIAAVPKSATPNPTSDPCLLSARRLRSREARTEGRAIRPTGRAQRPRNSQRTRLLDGRDGSGAEETYKAPWPWRQAPASTQRILGMTSSTWRMAAIGVAAARAVEIENKRAHLERSRVNLARGLYFLGAPAGRYEQRPDLIELRKTSELED